MSDEKLPPEGFELAAGWVVSDGPIKMYLLKLGGQVIGSASPDNAELAGAIVRKAEVPTCKPGCGVQLPISGRRDWCSDSCRDAGRPLHPAAEAPTREPLVDGEWMCGLWRLACLLTCPRSGRKPR